MSTYNVQVDCEDNDGYTLLKNIQIPVDQAGNVFLSPLVDSVAQKGFNVENCRCFYYSESDEAWVLVAPIQQQPDQKISIDELNAQNLIKIKLRPVNATPN